MNLNTKLSSSLLILALNLALPCLFGIGGKDEKAESERTTATIINNGNPLLTSTAINSVLDCLPARDLHSLAQTCKLARTQVKGFCKANPLHCSAILDDIENIENFLYENSQQPICKLKVSNLSTHSIDLVRLLLVWHKSLVELEIKDNLLLQSDDCRPYLFFDGNDIPTLNKLMFLSIKANGDHKHIKEMVDFYQDLLRHCPKLKSVSFEAYLVSPGLINTLTTHCPRLHSLSLNTLVNLMESGLLTHELLNLRSLALTVDTLLTDEELKLLVLRFPNLQELQVHYSSRYYSSDMPSWRDILKAREKGMEFLVSQYPKLQSLYLYGSKVK